jgi:hypothetical protein
MEDTSRSVGGTQGYRKFSGIKAQCMDLGQKVPKEELVAGEVPSLERKFNGIGNIGQMLGRYQ